MIAGHPETIPLATEPQRALEAAAGALAAGGVVLLPTDTVYGLAAATPQAVEDLFVLKGRPAERSVAVLVADRPAAESLAAAIPPALAELMDRHWPGPLTVVLPRRQPAAALAAAAPAPTDQSAAAAPAPTDQSADPEPAATVPAPTDQSTAPEPAAAAGSHPAAAAGAEPAAPAPAPEPAAAACAEPPAAAEPATAPRAAAPSGHGTAPAAGQQLGGDGDTVGVRCPDHDWLRRLLRRVGPLATTSANPHGLPTPQEAQQALAALATVPQPPQDASPAAAPQSPQDASPAAAPQPSQDASPAAVPQRQPGASIAVAIDGGPCRGEASTVVAWRNGSLQVLRPGPLNLAAPA